MDRKPTPELNSEYSTGIPGIDNQHSELFFMCNVLLKNLVKENHPPDAAYLSAQDIMRNLKNHCSTEEYLLDMVGFPKTPDHKIQHKKIFKTLNKELKAIKNSKGSDVSRFVRTFRDSLRTHISDADSEYAIHVKNLIFLRNKYNITALKAQVLVE